MSAENKHLKSLCKEIMKNFKEQPSGHKHSQLLVSFENKNGVEANWIRVNYKDEKYFLFMEFSFGNRGLCTDEKPTLEEAVLAAMELFNKFFYCQGCMKAAKLDEGEEYCCDCLCALLCTPGKFKDCSICSSSIIGKSRKLRCDHLFHEICIEKWMCEKDSNGEEMTCPLCRKAIESDEEMFEDD